MRLSENNCNAGFTLSSIITPKTSVKHSYLTDFVIVQTVKYNKIYKTDKNIDKKSPVTKFDSFSNHSPLLSHPKKPTNLPLSTVDPPKI